MVLLINGKRTVAYLSQVNYLNKCIGSSTHDSYPSFYDIPFYIHGLSYGVDPPSAVMTAFYKTLEFWAIYPKEHFFPFFSFFFLGQTLMLNKGPG